MLIPVGFAQVNLKWGGFGLPFGAQTTFGVHVPTGQTPKQVADLVVDVWGDSGLMPLLGTAHIVTGCLVKFGPNQTGPAYERGANLVGGKGGQALPPNCCILVRKNTVEGGHTGSGRWYLPGITEEDSVGDGLIVGAFLPALETAVDAIHAGLDAAGVPMVLLNSSDSTDVTPLDVTSLIVQSRLATQRRRMRG